MPDPIPFSVRHVASRTAGECNHAYSRREAACTFTSTRTTPLHNVHSGLGARFTGFAGWLMPLRYDSDIAEHRAVREASGLFDLTHMGEIEITGPEAARYLDHALVGHLSKARIGRARYTMLCHENGGVLDDLVVYRLAERRYLVVANASRVAVVVPELRDRANGFDVEVRDRSAEYALLAVQGPRSAEIVNALTDGDVGRLGYYAITETRLAGPSVLLGRTGYTGEDGFEVFCKPEDAPGLWQALSKAGAPYGLQVCRLSCRDTLRLEAGMPLHGNESGVASILVGLVARGRRVPRHGHYVVDPDSGAVLGSVTSGAPSPTLGVPIAMAYVPPAHAGPGTRLHVDVRGTPVPAEVVRLPFYRRTH